MMARLKGASAPFLLLTSLAMNSATAHPMPIKPDSPEKNETIVCSGFEGSRINGTGVGLGTFPNLTIIYDRTDGSYIEAGNNIQAKGRPDITVLYETKYVVMVETVHVSKAPSIVVAATFTYSAVSSQALYVQRRHGTGIHRHSGMMIAIGDCRLTKGDRT